SCPPPRRFKKALSQIRPSRSSKKGFIVDKNWKVCFSLNAFRDAMGCFFAVFPRKERLELELFCFGRKIPSERKKTAPPLLFFHLLLPFSTLFNLDPRFGGRKR